MSTSQVSKIKTSCKNCAFAIYEGKTQISCLHQRIEKFGNDVVEAYDEDSEFYVINRFCNYYRNRTWGYSESDIEKTESESATKFALFLNCQKLFKFDSNDIVTFINSIDYYVDKISVVLFHEMDKDTGIKCFVSNIAREINKKITISVCYNTNDFLHNQTVQNQSWFHGVIDSLNFPTKDFATKINDIVNKETKKVFTFEDNNVLFINNDTYKVMSYMNESKNYETNIYGLKEHSKQLMNHIIL